MVNLAPSHAKPQSWHVDSILICSKRAVCCSALSLHPFTAWGISSWASHDRVRNQPFQLAFSALTPARICPSLWDTRKRRISKKEWKSRELPVLIGWQWQRCPPPWRLSATGAVAGLGRGQLEGKCSPPGGQVGRKNENGEWKFISTVLNFRFRFFLIQDVNLTNFSDNFQWVK